MNTLKLFLLTVLQVLKQAWALPLAFVNSVRRRRLQIVLKEHEVERLDRIRNPWKYLGK